MNDRPNRTVRPPVRRQGLPGSLHDRVQQNEQFTLVDIVGVSDLLGVSARHIRRMVFERRIPYLKVGRLLRFDRAEIAIWLERSKVDPIG